MKILITGGLGVNGAWVVRRLLERNQEVVVIDNRDDRGLLADVGRDLRVEVADVTDNDRIRAIVDGFGPDCVIHMAAIIGADDDPLAAIRINVDGTAVVCDAAANAGVARLIYTSSRAVYGDITGRHAHPEYLAIDEDFPRRPTSLYGITKNAGEDVVEWFSRRQGMESASLRFATIFGPGKVRHGGFAVYSSLIDRPRAGQAVHIVQGGDQRDDMIYVVDAADAIVEAALAPAGVLTSGAYNVGTGRTHSLHDLRAAVLKHIPDASISIGAGLDPMGMAVASYGALSSSRADADFGWRPKYTLATAVGHHLEAIDRLGL